MAAGAPVAVGIDLGTTYSVVGVWSENRVQILANERGARTTASVVSFKDQDRLVGDSANDVAASNAANTVFCAKRLIGRNFTDPVVQAEMKHWPYSVVAGDDDKPMIEVNFKGEKKKFCAEEISSYVLGHMKKIAEDYLGTPVTSAVITVPAYFNDSQRQATKDAGIIAGLKVLRIINEPTAAAIAYGFECHRTTQARRILVFDLGGGTFDVSLLKIEDGIYEVEATNGHTHLGGEDFDSRIVEHCLAAIRKKTALDPAKQPRAMKRLRTACELAKRQLSSLPQVTIAISSLVADTDFSLEITRAKFEDLCSDLFLSTLEPVKKVLADAKKNVSDVDEIVLVGGSSRIPKIRALLSTFFGGRELNDTINPDEAIAYGATVQAAILTKAKSEVLEDFLLLDVTPLSLGLHTKGDVFSRVVERNANIPLERKKQFATAVDNQTEVLFRVHEGECERSVDNNVLGEFTITDLPLKPAGEVRFDVSFSIDNNGILSVTAKETSEGREGHIVLSNARGRLSAVQVQKMIEQAEALKKSEAVNSVRIHARMEFQNSLYRIHALLQDEAQSKQISPTELATLTALSSGGLEWLEHNLGADASVMTTRKSQLDTATHPILARFSGVSGGGKDHHEPE